jgi:acyl-CoA synthetase (AMP-forming)/AMP-acid ligase II
VYLTQGLHRSVQHEPQGLATVFHDRQRTWTECAARVARLAAAFLELGVRPGDRIAVLSLNSDRYYEAFLAVPWAGAVINPINTRWAAQEVAYAIVDSETGVLLVDETFASMVPEIVASVSRPLTVIYCDDDPAPPDTLDYEDLIAGHAPVADALRGGDELAAVYYTGGTTGRSRGVMLSHANLIVSALGTSATGAFT